MTSRSRIFVSGGKSPAIYLFLPKVFVEAKVSPSVPSSFIALRTFCPFISTTAISCFSPLTERSIILPPRESTMLSVTALFTSSVNSIVSGITASCTGEEGLFSTGAGGSCVPPADLPVNI